VIDRWVGWVGWVGWDVLDVRWMMFRPGVGVDVDDVM